MSTDLRGLLRDLAEDAPAIDNRIGLADTSYGAGLRRRRMRRLEVGGASGVALVLVLFASLLVGTSPPAAQYGASNGSSIQHYPSRIQAQWPVFSLPARPGPLAAVMSDNNTWYGVAASGHRWSLPFAALSASGQLVTRPMLSDDGRLLGYLGEGNDYVVHDLVTGHRTIFPGFNHDDDTVPGGYDVNAYENGFFSPDHRYLALEGMGKSGGAQIFVLDLVAGGTRDWQASIYEDTVIAGWLANDRLVLSGLEPVAGQQFTTRDLDGHVLATVSVQSQDGVELASYGAAAMLTPDRTQVAVLTNTTQVTRFSLATGRPTGNSARLPAASPCWWTATSDAVIVAAVANAEKGTVEGARVDEGNNTTTLTSVGAGVNADCLHYTVGAVQGSASGPLLVDQIDAWIVVSRWFLLGGLAVALIGTAAVRRRRRRQSFWRRPTASRLRQ